MISGVHHVTVNVSDLERSLRFYRDLLGMKEEKNDTFVNDPEMMNLPGTRPRQHIVMLSAGNTVVELIQFLEPIGKPDVRKTCDLGMSHIAFQVDDIREACKAMQTKGIDTFHRAPIMIDASGGQFEGYGFVFLRGPDNELIELMEVPS